MLKRVLSSLLGFLFYILFITVSLHVYLIESQKNKSAVFPNSVSYEKIYINWLIPSLHIVGLKHTQYGQIDNICFNLLSNNIKLHGIKIKKIEKYFPILNMHIDCNNQKIVVSNNEKNIILLNFWTRDNDALDNNEILFKVQSGFGTGIGRYRDSTLKFYYERFYMDSAIKGKILGTVDKKQFELIEKGLHIKTDLQKTFIKAHLSDFLLADYLKLKHPIKGIIDLDLKISNMNILGTLQCKKLSYKDHVIKNISFTVSGLYPKINISKLKASYKKISVNNGLLNLDLSKNDFDKVEKCKVPFIYAGEKGMLEKTHFRYGKYKAIFSKKESKIIFSSKQLYCLYNISVSYNLNNGELLAQGVSENWFDEVFYKHNLRLKIDTKKLTSSLNIKGFIHGSIDAIYKNKLVVDLKHLNFLWPSKLGEKKNGQACKVQIDFAGKTIELINQHLRSELKYDAEKIFGNVSISQPLTHMNMEVKYDLKNDVLYLTGHGKEMDGMPWLKAKIDPNGSIKMHVELHTDKLHTSAKGYLKDAVIMLDNVEEFPNVYIVGECVGKTFKKDKDAYIYITGPIPNRKILIQTHVADLMCKALDINLPMRTAALLINGVINKEYIEGIAQLDNLYMTKGLGVFRLLQFFSIGHWVNTFLQPNANFWPIAGAYWKYYPQEKLELIKIKAKNSHYTIESNGVIDLVKDTLEIHGNLVPQTLLQRFILSNLNTSAGIDFKIFGHHTDPKVQVHNKIEILPFFLP